MFALRRAARVAAARRGMASTPAQPTSSSSLWNINPAKPETWPTVKETMLPDAFHEVEHAKSSTKTWFWVNIFFTAPALGAVSWYVLPDEFNHIAHVHEHVKDYVAWPHLGKRKDVFPWRDGDKSLFHNQWTNPRPPKDE